MSQCTAHAKSTGNQCERSAIAGGNVCIMHGGSAPQVKNAARRRLLEMIDPNLVALEVSLESADENVRLRAVKEVLDRIGIAEPKQTEVFTLDAFEREIARLEAALSIEREIARLDAELNAIA